MNIPGYGEDKINASYAYGGAKLLVKTVEGLTKMKINHYVEVGMGGVKNVVDAVGGVEACLDYDVDDHDSGLIWNTAQGKCQQVNGEKALASHVCVNLTPLAILAVACVNAPLFQRQ